MNEIIREKNSFVIEVKEEPIIDINEEPEIRQLKPRRVKKKTKNIKKWTKTKKSLTKPKPSNGQWVCDHEDCGQRFNAEKQLQNHLWKHQKDNLRCSHPGCQYIGNHISKLKIHERKHTNEKPFECPECHKRYRCEYTVSVHIERCHKLLAEPLICDIDKCGKQFRTELSFNSHQLYHHIRVREKRFRCSHPDCGFEAEFHTKLVYHQKKHSSERPFVCPIDGCDLRYKAKNDLKLHIENIHTIQEESYRCTHEECGKTFPTELKLKKHKFRAHSEYKFHCEWPGCDYKCRIKERLVNHMVLHSDQYTIACIWPDCDKMFKTKGNLRQHLMIHKGEKKNACHWPGCQYRCITSGNLKIHINNVHNKKT